MGYGEVLGKKNLRFDGMCQLTRAGIFVCDFFVKSVKIGIISSPNTYMHTANFLLDLDLFYSCVGRLWILRAPRSNNIIACR